MDIGTDGEVKVVSIDSYGNVYIGGNFTQVGIRKTGPFAVWNSYTNAWVNTGLSASSFSPNSVVTVIDTDCSVFPSDATSYFGLFPCDILVGGNFKANVFGDTATNIMIYHSSTAKWGTLPKLNISSISTIKKSEFNFYTYYRFFISGQFHTERFPNFGLIIYDNSGVLGTLTVVDGVSGITDMFFNPNIVGPDELIIAASYFKETSCQGLCKNNITQVWSSVGSVLNVNKIRYLKSYSNLLSTFIATESTVKRKDGSGSFNTIGTINELQWKFVMFHPLTQVLIVNMAQLL